MAFLALACGGAISSAAPASAQVLARPGWAGSGVTVESWWHRAVFYRIDVSRFQDGMGNGRGNLAGVIQRLNYLQGLGVDALIIAPDAAGSAGAVRPGSQEGLDELTRQAVGYHLRVIVSLGELPSQRSDAVGRYLAQARAWLNQGVAGLYVPTRQLAALNNPNLAAYLVTQLRALTHSFPGQRILVADAAPDPSSALGRIIAHDAELTAAPPLLITSPDAASLRQQMLTKLGSSTTATTLLLASRHLPPNLSPQQREGVDRALAAILLASRSAVLIDYGQELGEEAPDRQQTGGQGLSSADAAPLMQWTPTNLTRQPKAALVEPTNSPSGVVYETYHPYVKPLPRTLFPPPPLPDVVLSNTPPPVDPNSLQGFTSGAIDPALAAPTTSNASTANVAIEDANPDSLLNLYRRLIQLHHENASVRNGADDVLDYDDVDALVWLRRAPAGSRTSATVVVVCNLSSRLFALALSALPQLHLRRGPLRNLLGTAVQPLARETTGDLSVPPDNVFVGEVNP